ncbi:MAG: PilT/PilU family type 4a pilus ATPase [Ostreibacterium sp.]
MSKLPKMTKKPAHVEKESDFSPTNIIAKLAFLLKEEQGSDIIINANSHPAIKVDGKIKYINNIKFSSQDTEHLAQSLMSQQQWTTFVKHNEINFMVDYPDIAYFRTNVFRQRGDIGLVLRLIPLEIPTIEELGLPDILKDLAMKKRGLILFSGATGVGKSTSLASLINYRNQQRADHIVTIEDPIEFLHTNQKSIITQREVGIDTQSYSDAMKSALRQAPDVILVGEIRDSEVMKQALAFAETGHLVFATIHATTAKLTLERIVNLFPHERREQLMQDLSQNLQAIITLRLMIRASGEGRIPALEIMSNTPHIQLLISESRFQDLNRAMERSTLKEGTISIDNYIFELYEQGKVTYTEALLYVDSPNNFRVRLRSESKNELPEELKSQTEHDWRLKKSADKPSAWGDFSKKNAINKGK